MRSSFPPWLGRCTALLDSSNTFATAVFKIVGFSMFEMWPPCSISSNRDPSIMACVCGVFRGFAPWSSLHATPTWRSEYR